MIARQGGSADPGRPADPDAPLRAELFSSEQMERHGRALASVHELAPPGRRGGSPLLARLSDNAEVLRESCLLLADAIKAGHRISSAGEWLLDNLYLIEEQIGTARRHFPERYSWELPRLARGVSAGLPRVYDLALNAIAHGDGRLDEDTLRRFAQAYQHEQPLSIGELWAIPIMLRLALIENLRRVAAQVRAERRERDLAAGWADAMIASVEFKPRELILQVADMARSAPPLTGPFVAELVRRLQGHSGALSLPITWIAQRLKEEGRTIEQLVNTCNQEEAADQVSVSNSIGSLRTLDAIDWRDFVESISHLEAALCGDPAGVYPHMDFRTRDSYRRAVETLARQARLPEVEVARRALARAADARDDGDALRAHVGWYVVDAGVQELERGCGLRPRFPDLRSHRFPFWLYLAAIVLLGALLAVPPLIALWRASVPAAWLVAAVPALLIAISELSLALVNRFASAAAQPIPLPRMDLRAGIPVSARTLVVIPCLLNDADAAAELASDLEVRFLANRDAELRFALLTDLPDHDAEHAAGDAAALQAATAAIQALNQRHAGGASLFLLLHRARSFAASEGVWMGRERKRGKLADLNQLLRTGDASAFDHIEGDLAVLAGIRYVITLDADTQLPHDAARKLVATMEHPLNHARRDPQSGRITGGYGILQPRIGTSFGARAVSRYALLMGGEPGIDPYTRAVSDTYQDLFGEGSYTGKGIYAVDTFEEAIGGRLPDARILSHDLLEGCHARSGLLSEVELYETWPPSFRLDARRRERWIRGDWQIAAWLFGRVPGREGRVRSCLSWLARWKIFDNLRRSLVPVALFTLLLMAWFLFQRPGWWSLLVLEIMLLPVLLDFAIQLARKPPDLGPLMHLGSVARGSGRQLGQVGFALAALPFEALLAAVAIVRTAWRVHVSRRNLLQWVSARDAARGRRARGLALWPQPLMALALGAALLALRPGSLPAALPWLLLWALAPAFEAWLARPPRAEVQQLRAGQHEAVRGYARRTWAFFEDFVTAADHWLPPDNFQEAPIAKLAHRTSPTNIGLYLLACLAARDLGFIGPRALLARIENSFATLRQLPRCRGHFYNWYDTQTLEPLEPHYVSTVDSGNLCGHLVVLREGLRELAALPLLPPRLFAGLLDTLRLGGPPVHGSAMDALCRQVALLESQPPATAAGVLEALRDLAARARAGRGEPVHSATLHRFLADCQAAITEAGLLLEGLDGAAVPAGTRLSELAARGGSGARALLRQAAALAEEADHLGNPDFRFLFDARRQLYTIGYNASESRLDDSRYDLLASEVRLAVYLTVARGIVPNAAWFALGRPLTTRGGPPTLLSWSGSMFEYLMPLLVMPAYPGSLLAESCRGAVLRQIRWGHQNGVPWGISESGYNLTDAAQNYQYRAFGAPGLGLQRGLSQELVVAPYASALALLVTPRKAADNLAAMAALGWLAEHGFHEAADYTPARLPPGADFVLVRSYMAHHQGMSLLAFAHVLDGQQMQRRFLADPECEAATLLLQERVPKAAGEWSANPAMVDVRSAPAQPQVPLRVFRSADMRHPAMQLLSNGRYHVMVTASGAGYSRWQGLAVTRWREDATRDAWGSFLYLRDADSGAIWSPTLQPTRGPDESMVIVFTDARAEFRRRVADMDSELRVVVSPEDDIELRRLRLTNRSRQARTIEITSYAEVVIAPQAADEAHPAFSNLFVETRFVAERDALVCTRRPRSADERPPWMFHLLAVHDAPSESVSCESDRMRFIGRNGSLAAPAAVHAGGELGGTTGAVLDPIVAIRHRLRIGPEQTITADLVTGVAASRSACRALMDKYHDRVLADRVLDLAWSHSRIVLGQINISESDSQVYARLAEVVVYVDPARRAPADVIASNRRGQSGLWGHSISGDLPIVLLRVHQAEHLELVRELVRAQAWCRLKGVAFDLVIWNAESGGYRQELHDAIQAIIAASPGATTVDRPGGIFVRALEQLGHEDRVLMLAVARVFLDDHAGSLLEQLSRRSVVDTTARLVPARLHEALPIRDVPVPARHLENGLGGFASDSAEYVIETGTGRRTPAPWVNVIANERLGCIISEAGAGYTWYLNAHEGRLTPWSNDAVRDPATEALYLRDEETGHYWSPTPAPVPGRGRYVVRHGFGYSLFETIEDGIASALRVHVDPTAPVKFFQLRLRNESGRRRSLSATAFVEWVLGNLRSQTAMHVVTEVDETGALLARNAYSPEFGAVVAFLDTDPPRRTLTGDRSEFIGRNRNLRSPAAMERTSLGGHTGAGLDPCGAMQVPLELADGEETTLVFRLGAGADRTEACALVRRFRHSGATRTSIEALPGHWGRMLGALQVETPDPALDALVNGWLLYQVIACRVWGRSGFYQSGGAYGYRDQLQDTMALVHAAPELLREQILRAAGRQFVEGDVQHWWHPPGGRGVRTTCSDDYLWLPYATLRWLDTGGDASLLDESAGFLQGRTLEPGEESYYDLPLDSGERAPLYEHCRRAIRRGLQRGRHGLPLIGGGDWNDGYNRIGAGGQGESVWLGFFQYRILTGFAPVAESRGDGAFAADCREEAARLRQAIDEHAWDGDRYIRAWYDDGTPLGVAGAEECRIDSIAQSWAILSGAGDPERAQRALETLDRLLVREDPGLIQLLDPPFDHGDHDPGYIRGYVPGVRENGGQYTHAAAWAVMALAESGRSERAWELIRLINPLHHGSNPDAVERWRVEPWIVAADVLAVEPHTGRGGWTWYTGSAAWLYRAITESLLGVHTEPGGLRLEPRLPAAWPGFRIRYRAHGSMLDIEVVRSDVAERAGIWIDGHRAADGRIPLQQDDVVRQVRCLVAGQTQTPPDGPAAL